MGDQDTQSPPPGSAEEARNAAKAVRKAAREAARAAQRGTPAPEPARPASTPSADPSPDVDPVAAYSRALREALDDVPEQEWEEKWRVLSTAQRRCAREQADASRKDAIWQSFAHDLAREYLAAHEERWAHAPFKHQVRAIDSKLLRTSVRGVVIARRDELIRSMVLSDGWHGDLETFEVARFGAGMDERVVELPLAIRFARLHEPGFVLDAGAALNVPVVRAVVEQPVARLVHFTQSSEREPQLFQQDRYSYLFGDLRAVPFDDDVFDRIVCVSSLEHIGMDNARYGGAMEHAGNSWAEAVHEMLRVLKPGGELLITVPFGRPAERGWYQIFGPEQVEALGRSPGAETAKIRYFHYDHGWVGGQSSPPAEALETLAPDEPEDMVRGMAAVKLTKTTGKGA